MEVNNELRRIKNKLRVFEHEAAEQVLSDFAKDLGVSEVEIIAKIEALKIKYKKFIHDNTPDGSRQGSLF